MPKITIDFQLSLREMHDDKFKTSTHMKIKIFGVVSPAELVKLDGEMKVNDALYHCEPVSVAINFISLVVQIKINFTQFKTFNCLHLHTSNSVTSAQKYFQI